MGVSTSNTLTRMKTSSSSSSRERVCNTHIKASCLGLVRFLKYLICVKHRVSLPK
eukprot:c35914_g1_i1 orf=167-331(+)